MPTLVFETTVRVPIERVWSFHEDVAAALPALSPPAARVKIESADVSICAGSRIVITARGPLGFRLRWVARIVEHTQPQADPAVASVASARFVDEQESRPFKSWRHEHTFTGIDEGSTRLTDRVTYAVRFGSLGRLADRLFVRRQVEAMFRHRHEVLPHLLASGPLSGVKLPA
jgi:ligand-binding SRPBCC domain-containing protein